LKRRLPTKKQVVFKKTSELTELNKTQIRELFRRIFERDMSEEMFKQRFINSCFGYSYHGLLLCGEDIVGSFSAIPYRYMYFGTETTFALSVDTMIAPEHRGGKANLIKMTDLVYEAMIKDGIPLIYGFPNELYYSHEKRILGTKDIGKLNYYILPLNLGAIKPKMKLLNPISQICSKAAINLPQKSQSKRCIFNINKIDDEIFQKHRYNNNYNVIRLDDGAKCFYKIYEEIHKARTLYLIDVSPMSAVSFNKAVKQIYMAEGNSVDIIIYVGNLPFKPASLIKAPKLLEPQKIRMTAKILDSEHIDDSVFEMSNWNANISNFDVR
jgi:hypothetical protein